MNRIATALLALTALALAGVGISTIAFWLSRPIEGHFAAGEMVGIILGGVILVSGIIVGLTARAVWRDSRRGWNLAALAAALLLLVSYSVLSTPGQDPVASAVSIGLAATGLALIGLAGLRATGRRAP